MDLELSPKERVFLANQLRILEALCPEEADGYKRWREAVEGGYSLHYSEGAPWLGSDMSVEDCREVLDILQMFSVLAWSYRELSDKAGIEPHDVKFPGFDGNNESAYLGYADYFINTLGRYDDLKDSGDGLNSHAPFLEAYRRMLEVWLPMQSQLHGGKLNKQQIQQINAARIHPENR
jgi:uncharacterized protein YfbU (UPF0304 family)